MLVAQLKKIESRKKEREKKSHDINKLITAADNKPSSSSHTGSSDTIHTTVDGHHIKWVFLFLFFFMLLMFYILFFFMILIKRKRFGKYQENFYQRVFSWFRKEKKLNKKNKKKRAEMQAAASSSTTTAGASSGSTSTDPPTTANKMGSVNKDQPAAIRFPEIKGSGVFLRSSKVWSLVFVQLKHFSLQELIHTYVKWFYLRCECLVYCLRLFNFIQ